MLKRLLAIFLIFPSTLSAQDGLSCRTAEQFRTQVQVNLIEKPVSIVQDITADEMQEKYKTQLYERQKKMKANYFLHDTDYEMMKRQLSGVTRADLDFKTDISFVSMPQDNNHHYCLLFKEVSINVTYQTVMTIASNLKEGECVYEAVKDYQMKYHDANRKVVQAVSQQMREDLPKILVSHENSMVGEDQIPTKYQEMQAGVEAAVGKYREDMDMLMQEYRSHIDTPEELKKLADSCKSADEKTGVADEATGAENGLIQPAAGAEQPEAAMPTDAPAIAGENAAQTGTPATGAAGKLMSFEKPR